MNNSNFPSTLLKRNLTAILSNSITLLLLIPFLFLITSLLTCHSLSTLHTSTTTRRNQDSIFNQITTTTITPPVISSQTLWLHTIITNIIRLLNNSNNNNNNNHSLLPRTNNINTSGTPTNPTRHFMTSMLCHRALKNLLVHRIATANQLYLPSMKLTTAERALKLKMKTQLMHSLLLLTLLFYTLPVSSSPARQPWSTITLSQVHLWTSPLLRNNNLNSRMLTNSAWFRCSTSWQMSSQTAMKSNTSSSTSSAWRDLEKWDKKLISSLYLISESSSWLSTIGTSPNLPPRMSKSTSSFSLSSLDPKVTAALLPGLKTIWNTWIMLNNNFCLFPWNSSKMLQTSSKRFNLRPGKTNTLENTTSNG